jgi:hypothetical protein
LYAQRAVSPVGFSRSTHIINAFSPGGQIALAVVRLQIDISYPDGKRVRADLVVVYDRRSGHYFWLCHPQTHEKDTSSFLDALEADQQSVYSGPGSLIEFALSSALYESEHSGRAESLPAAERASIEEIERNLPAFEQSGFRMDSRIIPITKALGNEFRCAPLHAECHDENNRIVSIAQEGGKWRLVLRNRFDVEIVLESKFNLVSSRRITEPPS